MGRKAAQRNVVGIEESDELSSEQGGEHARKRQRAEDAAISQLGSKRAHQLPPDGAAAAAAAAGTDAGADEPMEEQQEQQQQEQQAPPDSPQQDQQDQPEQLEQQRRSASAGGGAAAAAAAASGTPFTAQAAFASAFPDQPPDNTPPGAAAAAAPSGDAGQGGSGGKQAPLRQSSRRPKTSQPLDSQPSGLNVAQLGTRLKRKEAESAAKEHWPGPDYGDNWGRGSKERPEVDVPEPRPEGRAAVGWGVWVRYDDMDMPWWRGVISCYGQEGWKNKPGPHYQVVMEDGEINEEHLDYIKNEADNDDFLFAYPPKDVSVPPPISKQLSLPTAEEAEAPDDAAAAAAAQEAPAPASAQAKTKARSRGSQQPKGAPAAGGNAAAEAAAGEQQAAEQQPPGGSGAHAKKQQPKQQQQQRKRPAQQKPAQQKPAPLRAATPTSPGPPSARPAAPPPALGLSRLNLSDRAGKLARCLQQLQAADQQVAQGVQRQAAALTEILSLSPDFATGKEVKDACGTELLQTLARFKGRADRAAAQLSEQAGMAEKARCCMQPAQQQRGAAQGGAAAAAAAAAGRPGDAAAALAAAKQQLARAQSERAAAEQAAAEARAAAQAQAEMCDAARMAAAAAEERFLELESFASRLKLLVPLEALEDGSPVRAKAVAMLVSVLLPPVAVSPFQAASELEGMLFRDYGLVGAGKDMYLKHLYLMWCALGGRELAAAAEASSEAARAAEEAAAAAEARKGGQPDAAEDADADVQAKQQAAATALAKAQEVLAGAPGVADAATMRNALLDGSTTVSQVFQMTCSKLGFDKQRDK